MGGLGGGWAVSAIGVSLGSGWVSLAESIDCGAMATGAVCWFDLSVVIGVSRVGGPPYLSIGDACDV